MEIIIGLIAYMVVLFLLLSFIRFCKECDNSLRGYCGKEDVMIPIARRLSNSIEDIRQIESRLNLISTSHPKGLTPFPSFWAIITQHIHRYTHP